MCVSLSGRCGSGVPWWATDQAGLQRALGMRGGTSQSCGWRLRWVQGHLAGTVSTGGILVIDACHLFHYKHQNCHLTRERLQSQGPVGCLDVLTPGHFTSNFPIHIPHILSCSSQQIEDHIKESGHMYKLMLYLAPLWIDHSKCSNKLTLQPF